MKYYYAIFSLTIGVSFIIILFLFLPSVFKIFGQDIPFNVAAVGDISCNDDGKQTISMIANSHPNLVIFLGDLSYDKSLVCFFEQTKVLENNGTTKVLVTIGNHDIDTGDGNGETKKQLLIHYNIPRVGYYSKTFDHDGG